MACRKHSLVAPDRQIQDRRDTLFRTIVFRSRHVACDSESATSVTIATEAR